MPRLTNRISRTVGRIPGDLIHVGDRKTEKVLISVIDYDAGSVREKSVSDIAEVIPFRDAPTITWVNIDGLHDTGLIERVGEYFSVHSLTLEDIVNTGQRPKYEDFEKHIFIVLKMFTFDENSEGIDFEQMSLILGSNFVISIQEKEGDVFNPLRERIRNGKGRIRKMGADYLAYSILDAVVDNYFVILERIGDKIEEMDEELIKDPRPQILQSIQDLKRSAIYLRKSIWPLREVVNGLARSESKLVKKPTHIFLRDLYDHTIQVIDTIETFRDMVSGMLDIYLSSVSNKMNEIMKVLTIFAAIFIPLTFIVGIYGMNFDPAASKWNMPELHWRFGYLGIWVIMLIVTGLMLFYFKRKKWI